MMLTVAPPHRRHRRWAYFRGNIDAWSWWSSNNAYFQESSNNYKKNGLIIRWEWNRELRLTIIWYLEQGRMVPRGSKVEVMSKGGVMNSTMRKTNFSGGRFHEWSINQKVEKDVFQIWHTVIKH
ncbi:hypothetical protein L2E82_32176 [Cichorium intybus]|uniref:Uncharacterized protein n=1 Tax=Cichorium intybus TaxID=13427 RepID=A0ACB9BGS6_CICIN|nr:hypothetical protein L2E82_32176 [Cichorium intybus]